MMRAFLYFLAVALIAAGAAWLADRPGEVMLTWQGWRVETSVTVLIVAVIALVAALMLLWTILRVVFGGPSALAAYFRARRREKGLNALSRGMIAAAAGDRKLARRHAGEARKLMRGEPLTLLLEAQSAQLAGDAKAARKAFETMLAAPETELLGLRGLYVEAERAGDDKSARFYAARASERAPGLPWAATAVLGFHTRDGDWQAALADVERNADSKLIDRNQAKRARAVLLTARAGEREETDPDGALELALEAHRLAPELVPAAAIAGRLAAAGNDTRQASRILEKTWRLSPHPEIAEIYAHARPGDSARDRLKRAQSLAAKQSGEPEGRIAVAQAAIEARDWKIARDALRPLLIGTPRRRVCLLMAEIEQGEHGDTGRVREWLARALRARRDPAWVADGFVSDRWAPVSPVTGRLDAFEWTTPPESIAPPDEVPDEGEPERDRLVIEAAAEPPAAEAPKVADAEPAGQAEPPGPAPQPAPEASAPEPSPTDQPAPAPPRPRPANKPAAPVIIDAMPRPPDDPGPDPEPEDPATPPARPV